MRNNLWTNSPRNPIKTNQDTVYINYFFCFLSYAWTLSHLYSLNRALHFGSSTRTYAIPGEFLRSKYIILGKRWGYELNTNNPHDTYHWCNNCAPQGVRNSHWTRGYQWDCTNIGQVASIICLCDMPTRMVMSSRILHRKSNTRMPFASKVLAALLLSTKEIHLFAAIWLQVLHDTLQRRNTGLAFSCR